MKNFIKTLTEYHDSLQHSHWIVYDVSHLTMEEMRQRWPQLANTANTENADIERLLRVNGKHGN